MGANFAQNPAFCNILSSQEEMSPSEKGGAGVMFQAHHGLWPAASVICGLHRGLLGAGDLYFLGAIEFSRSVCLGSQDAGLTVETPLYCCRHGGGRRPSRWRGRCPHPHVDGLSQPGETRMEFQNTCHMLPAQGKKSFCDSLESNLPFFPSFLGSL